MQIANRGVDYKDRGGLTSADEDGVIRSQVFPGLWLAANDLLAGNMGRVLAVLQEGLATPEHTAFVQ